MPSRARKPRKVAPSIISKDRLAAEVARVLDERGLTQTEASYIIRDAPSQISLMVTGKTRGFSTERFFRTLTRLGRDVDIVVRRSKGGRAGKVTLNIK
jgi:predicted XRE-type DNA-binding protein